ncbi:hypothetical protein DSO57_1036259 [Entomophthora muscae]|uniref:Uncharacterized protein n=1 Tax=Entomophthora muscae TaxID=34485 RepID=A0ACC2SP58_9FUNG|nr:hypothetical protein DSO57_1036259 [Entomophthora muscae]
MKGDLSVSPKWLSLLGACLCTTPAGVVYAFSLFGPQLAVKLGYTSKQINFVAAAGSLGVYVTTPFFGYFADTKPPMRLAWLAACFFLIGFYAIALTYDGTLTYRHYSVIAFYYFLVGMGCACSNIVALSTTGHNFKDERGIGIGIPVTLFGLSASIFSMYLSFILCLPRSSRHSWVS